MTLCEFTQNASKPLNTQIVFREQATAKVTSVNRSLRKEGEWSIGFQDAQKKKQEVNVDVALVHFIDDHVAHSRQQRVTLHAAQQNSRGA